MKITRMWAVFTIGDGKMNCLLFSFPAEVNLIQGKRKGEPENPQGLINKKKVMISSKSNIE